jgi:hypothetical protein
VAEEQGTPRVVEGESEAAAPAPAEAKEMLE